MFKQTLDFETDHNAYNELMNSLRTCYNTFQVDVSNVDPNVVLIIASLFFMVDRGMNIST